jgi:hypothetical protein
MMGRNFSLFGHSDTDGSAGLLSGQQDLDLSDPAALLESLASYEHPSTSNAYEHPPLSSPAPISNDHFASLLQAAAATAGGQDVIQQTALPARTSPPRAAAHTRYAVSASRLSLPSIPQPHPPDGTTQISDTSDLNSRSSKRRRIATDPEEALLLARERAIWGQGPDDAELHGSDGDDDDLLHHPSLSTSEARAAGVASAVALFRKPSTASKKSTRPPMSKIFTTLELTPEQFVHLQAAAKAYMLSPHHPERRDCVGGRGKADSDMIKLKLFDCVRSFLEDEGWGEKCWGEEADGVAERRLRWPGMSTRIVTLVTPLLRRMVTNERQREYARGARAAVKAGSGSPRVSEGSGGMGGAGAGTGGPATGTATATPSRDARAGSRSRDEQIDPNLGHSQSLYQHSYDTAVQSPLPDVVPAPARGALNTVFVGANDDGNAHVHSLPQGLTYHISLLTVNTHTRNRPKLILPFSSCPDLQSLHHHIRRALSSTDALGLTADTVGIEGIATMKIQALCHDGMRLVTDEEGWEAVNRDVREREWMDGEVRVVVTLGLGEEVEDGNGDR